MKAIRIVELDIEKIFSDVFMGLTQTIAKIKLKNSDPFDWDGRKHIHILVQTTGTFCAIILCSIEESLKNAICYKMAFGIEGMTQETLIQEYMNVLCGNGISMINTKMKKVSRLSVPCIIKKEEFSIEIEPQQREETIWFTSEYGNMSLEIVYKTDAHTNEIIRKE